MTLTEEEKKVRHKEASRKYRLTHPEKVKEISDRWKKNHKSNWKKYCHDYYISHKAECIERNKRYKAEHLENARQYMREYQRARRARIKAEALNDN